jgi:tRNA(Arg) A34 adenosine deaminase TadA
MKWFIVCAMCMSVLVVGKPPNIVFFLTDDQAVQLGDTVSNFDSFCLLLTLLTLALVVV